MKKLLILLSVIILSLSTQYVIADDNIEKEIPQNIHLKSSDIKKLYKKAKHHDVDAAYELGLAYANGDGVTKDEEEAKKWLQLSASQGHEPSKQLLDRLSQP